MFCTQLLTIFIWNSYGLIILNNFHDYITQFIFSFVKYLFRYFCTYFIVCYWSIVLYILNMSTKRYMYYEYFDLIIAHIIFLLKSFDKKKLPIFIKFSSAICICLILSVSWIRKFPQDFEANLLFLSYNLYASDS